MDVCHNKYISQTRDAMTDVKAKTNKYSVNDGRSFVINPDLEAPGAWDTKKAFIISIGEHELRHKKIWTATILRLLATGMIEAKNGNKYKKKDELLDGFAEMLQEARNMGALRYAALADILAEGGYNAAKLDAMLTALSGDVLINAIEATLKGNGYADSTIIKTYLPDIYKAMKLFGTSVEDIALLKSRFRPMMTRVNSVEDARVIVNVNNVRAVKWEPLQSFLDGLDIETAGWKHLSVFVTLATGRRMAETHGEGTIFDIVDSHHVMFTGQLKTKGRLEGAPPYIIKTLAEASRVVAAWERLKTLRAPLSPHFVNRKLSTPLSSEMPIAIKLLFGEAGIEEYRDMRNIYAVKMLAECPVTMTANAFVARCMGHGEDDLKSANTYQKLRIV